MALHGAGHERGCALRARAPRGRARDERAPPLLPEEVQAGGSEGAARASVRSPTRGEGGFDKTRIGGPDGNRSIQYAGARFTVTPMTAARAAEAEVKFAQGAKPGKGGQLPGKKVSPRIAHQRGCEPGYELVSPPVNHNLYSIEDVKLMVESWRHLNPDVRARAQVRGDARRRDGVHGRRQRRCQPAPHLGRLRRHGRRQARRPEARRRAGGRGAAGGPGHAGRGGRPRARRALRRRRRAHGRARAQADAAGRRPHRLRHVALDVDRLLDAAPVPHGRSAAGRHHRQAPPGLHGRRRDPGPVARREIQRARAATRRGCCATSRRSCAS